MYHLARRPRSTARATHILALLLLATALLAACAGSSNSSDSFRCPTTADTITWSAYGSFALTNSGNDSTARQCISTCGWHVFGGHDGGTGDTLQVATPGEEVAFAWAYNIFSAFRVKTGWTGQTDRGVRLGDSQATFLSHYPEFTSAAANHLTYNASGTQIDAYFDSTGALYEINVGGYIAP
jgi:hypothetical protein